MAAGDATAADVPGKYDLVINGKGYCLLDSLESSIPFRTHRAIYGQTQPFVERQNVSNSFGDNTQDFFMSIRQRDWSLGEQQKYFRAGQDGRYYQGTNVETRIPGQVNLRRLINSVTFAGAIVSSCLYGRSLSELIAAASSTNLYTIDQSGTITDRGAHGLGAAPGVMGMISDANNIFMASSSAGSVGVRRWSGSAFSTFSGTSCDSLAYLNNTLYGYSGSSISLVQFSTAGVASTLYTWQDAVGATQPNAQVRIEPYGGQLLILRQSADRGGELWTYDGAGVKLLHQFPSNFVPWELEVVLGVAFISGNIVRRNGSNFDVKPTIIFYQNGQVGTLWQANNYLVVSDPASSAVPALAGFDNGLVFTDDSVGSFLYYDLARGGVNTIGSYTVSGSKQLLASTNTFFLYTKQTTTANMPDKATFATSGTVISSLIDFDTSLAKQFRGVRVEFDAATDGDGGSVDIAYQTDSLTGSWTNLRTAAVSGTEYTLTSVSGHAIAIRVTINKGTSTAGPSLRGLSVRGAPVMPIYPRGEYIIDCTGTGDNPRELRDGTSHPLSGYEQVQNLVTARSSQSPVSITDKVNGTFTGFVDVADNEGFDVYEIHPAEDNPSKSGSYVVRLTVRGV